MLLVAILTLLVLLPSPSAASTFKADIPFLLCPICKHSARELHRSVSALRAKTPGGRVREETVGNLVEQLCDPTRAPGAWLRRVDVVEEEQEGGGLLLRDQEGMSHCRHGCKVLAEACRRVVAEYEIEIGEAMVTRDLNRAKLANFLCFELSGVCKAGANPPLANRTPWPAWEAMEEEEERAEQARMDMEEAMPDGSPRMKMFKREDLMKEIEEMKRVVGGRGDEEEEF